MNSLRNEAADTGKIKEIERKHISRIYFSVFVALAVYAVIAVQLFNIQVVKHGQYSKKYSEQSRKRITVHAPKGIIYDRKYSKLAENIGMNFAFGVNARFVKNKKDLAARISSVTGEESGIYLNQLNSKSGFVWVVNNLTEIQKNQILGLLKEDESTAAAFKLTANRIYPRGKIGGQIVGYTDIDGNGLSGIEKEFGEQLTGTDGWEDIYKDGKQKKSFGSGAVKKEPVPGNSIVLTIDDNYQAIAEDELERAVTKWKGKKGVIIVMEPKSGEILALASYPNFDPNQSAISDAFERKHKAITDTYEPGSTFKSITAAILFEEKLVNEEDMFFCSNKGYTIGKYTIKDSHKNENEWMNFNDVIGQSSNTGTLQAAMRLSKDKFYAYLRDFGFGSKTDLELTGEVKGSLRKLRDWSTTTMPTMSFGQGITVTPLQLITSYCVIANGGTLVKPMIVKGIIDKDNKVVKKYETQTVRKVMGAEAAARTRKILRYVVEKGTGVNAEVPGMMAAGKTGTSQKVVDGSYSRKDYDASFIGMVPYDDPSLVCLVMIDSPRGSIYGGTVCAPVFKNVITRIYQESESGLTVSRKKTVKYLEVPDLAGMSASEAVKILEKSGISYKLKNDSEKICYQSKKPFSLIEENESLILSGPEEEKENGDILELTPSAVDLSSREAVKLLHSLNITPVVTGRGNVFKQSAIYNNEDNGEKVCSLFCRMPVELIAKKTKPSAGK
jgi:cell division protein FtsI/penicillin-binding protein 2